MHALGLHRRAGALELPRLLGLIGLLSLSGLLGPSDAYAADAADRLDRERIRAGVWAGPSVINGLMQLRTDGANADTSIDYLPAINLGVELWPDPNIGTVLGLELGTGAGIQLPAEQGSKVVDYNLYRFEAGGRYRWYFGPRSNAPSVILQAGLRGRYQTAQEQRPISILIDRIVAGPEAGLGFAWPVLSDRVWFRASGRLGLPFFVREPDDDSGQLAGGLAFGARLDVAVRVTGGWYVQLFADMYDEELDFDGDGTRASGVTGTRTHDRFLSGGLAARYAL